MKPAITCIIAVAVFFVSFTSSASAHDAFKKPLEEKYNLKTVSCKTCHPNNKDRSVHNEFGQLFLPLLKEKNITKKFKEAEAKGEDAVKAYEPEMAKHFLEALKVVEKKNMTFEDLMKYGLLNGVRLNTKKE